MTANPISIRGEAEILSGTQALVRGIIAQAEDDRRKGWNTAGFVSGYRGSPFGNVDLELWQMEEALKAHSILFQPGLNEDMAATACWGTQQVPLMENPRYDGVFAFWYGKGPGVDRSGDPFKHGNLAGTSPKGGVVLLAGDDHGAKSSSTAHQSEHAFVAASIPVFNPSSIEEYFDYIPTAVAMSRFAGTWIGFKCATEIVEASAVLPLERSPRSLALPEVESPAGGYHISNQFAPLAQEESLYRYRLPAARAFLAANGFDRVTLDSPRRSLGIVAPGKAHVDVQEALRVLGLNAERSAELGIRILKPMVTWPLDPVASRAFVEGHREVIVVEEKRSLVEWQLAQMLLAVPDALRPALSGKTTPEGRPLLPEYGELSAANVALALADRLEAAGLLDAPLREARERVSAELAQARGVGPTARAPMFCSGCPHNRSTRVPEGSEALGGIGCHGMAMWIPELRTRPSTHMGGEGGSWLGIAPFGGPRHIFQNMGDGTYAHSGLLAIRAAIAANVNITYKILCNSAVAMTGGQPVEGSPDAGAIARQTLAEGARKVVLVSEDPEAFTGMPHEIEVHHRDELMRIQRELRDIEGVTVLVYDQGCAAERRRLRKKGEYPDLPIRTFINSDVCEGCGDCNRKSSCVSVLPLETELGVKRQIDQESCNKDYTCIEGFCPSFITVTGGQLRKGAAKTDLVEDLGQRLQTPELAALKADTFNIVLAGIGGTGIITLGATLARAAWLEGQQVLTFDVTGVSQKNGAVFSHVRFLGTGREEDFRPRVPREQLDLLIGCDAIAATASEVVQLLAPGRTHAVLNAEVVPTAAFQRDPGFDTSFQRFDRVIGDVLGADAVGRANPGPGVLRILGSGPLLNIFMLGFACQQGLLPLKMESLERAFTEGRGGNSNLLAFRMGRMAAQDPATLDELTGAETPPVPLADLPLEDVIRRCRELLTTYQNAAYADRYERFVRKVAAQDPQGDFTHAVALNLFKLMRYKDEYEVARLHASKDVRRRLDRLFEGSYRLNYHLAPPLLSFRKNDAGEPKKIRFGGWMRHAFSLLRHFKFLRGTWFDPFGLSADRKLERKLISDYEEWIEDILPRLEDVDYETAVAIAALPDEIRGYGPVKERSVEAAREKQRELFAACEPAREEKAA
ncbi:indolepyruvate ferredoxin oxidoreductase [Tardibacter chloracetimidivorans]|uniref:Indolepyruvate ferredoxin oxidoreductase n=1 Tax=Tardibacter chloracetimidivorans TaxID=1921510 RepID=A0A1L3ZUU2_9SPHN|nr:indolepyruvate ferredoxin oxidoreductase family protein [Tardibacter chloracetimidivorans]API59403.1 indolepyruvate ferredoxin oxidoreductase [Tardibacter chloracetimidivorans]